MYKTMGLICKGVHAVELLLWKTLFATPQPLYCWKAKNLSFLDVLLVLGVKLACLLIKMCKS